MKIKIIILNKIGFLKYFYPFLRFPAYVYFINNTCNFLYFYQIDGLMKKTIRDTLGFSSRMWLRKEKSKNARMAGG